MKGLKWVVMAAVFFLAMLTGACSLATPASDKPADTAKGSVVSKDAYDPGAGWTQVWSDEFNGSSLNTAVWNVEDRGDGGGNAELEYYTTRPQNVSVSGGVLNLTAIRESYGGKSFTSGRINSLNKFSFRYGKIAARIKVPTGKGMWPAFWMMGTDFPVDGWPNCGEMDILEMAGDGGMGDRITMATLHWWNNGSTYTGVADYGTRYTNSAALGNDFHIYELEWDTNMIVVRFDGIQYYAFATGTNKAVDTFQFDQYIILNLAVGGNGVFVPGILDPNAITAPLPQSMQVDWVRVYAPKFTMPPALNGSQNICIGSETHTGIDVFGRQADIDTWAGTCTLDANATGAAEGSKCWKFTCGNLGWMGFDVSTVAWGENLANYAGRSLHFKIKTTSTAGYQYTIGSHGKTAYKALSIPRDGNWQTVTMPLSSFGGVNLSAVTMYLMFVSTTAPANGDVIYIDDVYIDGSGAPVSSSAGSASSASSVSSGASIVSATASTVYGANTADLSFDKNTGTRWESAQGSDP